MFKLKKRNQNYIIIITILYNYINNYNIAILSINTWTFVRPVVSKVLFINGETTKLLTQTSRQVVKSLFFVKQQVFGKCL